VVLLFLESIGTTELLLIMVVALVVFGPRRLPDIGRKIGKSMADFRRTSDDFKRSWEREVELEKTTDRNRLPGGAPAAATTTATAARDDEDADPLVLGSENSISRGRHAAGGETDGAGAQPSDERPATAAAESAPRQDPQGKADWL